MAASEEIQAEALSRAVTGQALTNYPAIFEGFMAKGIPEAEILPRENVFTFHAWKALGRVVRKGEHGVRITTWIEYTDKRDGERKRRPKASTVFHVSQTKPINGDEPEPPAETMTLETPGGGSLTFECETVTPDPKPAPVEHVETESAHRLSVSFGSASLGTVPGPCPHTRRKIEPGMPCVECGATVHDS